jgi:hypothetical protein
MRRYGSLAAIAAADAAGLAAACSIGLTLAKTVTAAARLALEDSEAESRRLGGLAAAEPKHEYGRGGV